VLLLLLLPHPPTLPFNLQIRTRRVQEIQQQLGLGRGQTVSPLPYHRLLHMRTPFPLASNACLPQQHAASVQPLDPDLLPRQASHMRYSSVFPRCKSSHAPELRCAVLRVVRRTRIPIVLIRFFSGRRRRLDRPSSAQPYPHARHSPHLRAFSLHAKRLSLHSFSRTQIHTAYETQAFGGGNCFAEGISQFLSSHRCNAICKYLNLPPTLQAVKQSSEGTNYHPLQ
jgi:hypothetical protein